MTAPLRTSAGSVLRNAARLDGIAPLRAAARPPAAASCSYARGLHSSNGWAGRRPQLPGSPAPRGGNHGAKLLYAAAPFSLWSWLTGASKEAPAPAAAQGADADANDGPLPTADLPGKSSTLAYPAAARAQRSSNGVSLVFLNANAPLSETANAPPASWRGWLSYFREAGYDCLAVSAVHASGDFGALATELEQQVRLQMLQRGAVLFARGEAGARVAAEQLKGATRTLPGGAKGQSQFAAAVLIAPGEAGVRALQAIDERVRSRLALFVLDHTGAAQQAAKLDPKGAGKNWEVVAVASAADADSGKRFKEVEIWLMEQGL